MEKLRLYSEGVQFVISVITKEVPCSRARARPAQHHTVCFHEFLCQIFTFWRIKSKAVNIYQTYVSSIELMINKLHGLSPSSGSVSPSGGFASLLFDQVEYFGSIKLCQALNRQGAIIKIPVVRCHYL